MEKLIFWFILFLLACQSFAKEPKHLDNYFNKIVNAIYIAEGGAKAQYAYGIVSVKYRNKIEARRICYNTVRNNFYRWHRAGRKGDFLKYLGGIYCPTKGKSLSRAERKLNRYWIKNVSFHLTRKKNPERKIVGT